MLFQDASNVIYEDESKSVKASLANAISWDISNRYAILVVTMNSWQVSLSFSDTVICVLL